METTLAHTTAETNVSLSKPALWAGRIISVLCIVFLLFDAITKVIREPHVIDSCRALGIPENTIQGVGITLLICTVVYIIPRTSIIGAILLTGYLGGAMAIMMRAGQQVYFAMVFAILVWLGLYLRSYKLRQLVINLL